MIFFPFYQYIYVWGRRCHIDGGGEEVDEYLLDQSDLDEPYHDEYITSEDEIESDFNDTNSSQVIPKLKSTIRPYVNCFYIFMNHLYVVVISCSEH